MPAISTAPSAAAPRLQLVDEPGPHGELPLLRHDPELRAAVDAADLPLAERAVVARRLVVPDGPWAPVDVQEPGQLAILLDGLLVQELHLANRTSAQLLGPGAVMHDLQGHDSSLPCELTLTSLGTSTIALLDGRFALAARRWPQLWQIIHLRLGEQLKNAARWNAVTALPRVEQRVLAAFWLMADRWGVRRRDGIAIHLALTHEFIGTMVAARRPTISLALTDLAERGILTSSGRRDWLLDPASAGLLESSGR